MSKSKPKARANTKGNSHDEIRFGSGPVERKFSNEGRAVRVVGNAILGIVAVALVTAGLGSVWFYVYSDDIRGIDSVGRFAPDETTTLHEECSSDSVRAVPFKALGTNLLNAVRAAEEDNERMLAFQISRGLLCNYQGKMVQRHLLEYKASVHLRRRFPAAQLLTIYLNRAHFGDAVVGVENASEHFYHKHPAELNVSQAAMIGWLIKGPGIYSPSLHPGRAKARRDTVIAAMLKRGTITEREARAAEASPVPDKN